MKFKQLPNTGDTRFKVKFAFFPKLIGNLDGGHYIWFELYVSVQRYRANIFESLTWHEVDIKEFKK